jgi:hypothetical protein
MEADFIILDAKKGKVVDIEIDKKLWRSVNIELFGCTGLCKMNYYTDGVKSFVNPDTNEFHCADFKSCRVRFGYHNNQWYHRLFQCSKLHCRDLTKDCIIDVSGVIITKSYGKFIIEELRYGQIVDVKLSDWKRYSLYFPDKEEHPWYVLYCKFGDREYIKPCEDIFKCENPDCIPQFGYHDEYYELLFSLTRHCNNITINRIVDITGFLTPFL